MDEVSIGAALERLDAWCSEGDREELLALRPPATEDDLDELRRAIDPYEIPPELVALLRWHNGQERSRASRDLLPIAEGPLLGTSEAQDVNDFLRNKCEPWQWCPLWVPILQERWSQVGVEVSTEGPGIIIDASFPDPEVQVLSSSLAALLHATADMAEAGVLFSDAVSGPEYRAWYAERKKMMEARSEQVGWSHWPFERIVPLDEQGTDWPPHWRAARGFGADDAD